MTENLALDLTRLSPQRMSINPSNAPAIIDDPYRRTGLPKLGAMDPNTKVIAISTSGTTLSSIFMLER